MKVTQKEDFKPITIVLESEEEAFWMWLSLNVNAGEVKEVNKKFLHKSECLLDEETHLLMWRSFNSVYPREEH